MYRRSSKRRRSISPDDRSRSRSRDRHRKTTKSNEHRHRDHHRHSHSKPDRHKQTRFKSEDESPSKSLLKTEKASKSVNFDAKSIAKKEAKNEKKKEDFNESGALKQDLESTKNGVVLKYSEPPEGAMCRHRKWRLYCYKGDEQLNVFHLHRKSFFLIGRDERV